MKERDSNIELLRIFATISIIILHCNGWFLIEWGGGVTDWKTGGWAVATSRSLIQSVTLLGVDVFILISGFYGIRPKLKSIVNLFTLLLFFYVVCYIWNCYLGKEMFSIIGLIKHMLAFSWSNWFINSYLFLMLLSPVINKYVNNSQTKKLAIYILCYCVLTLYMGCIRKNEYWWYNGGYSITMMLGVYLVGQYLSRVVDDLGCIRYWHLIVAFICMIVIMSILRVFLPQGGVLLQYGSPIVIVAAVLLFLLFYHMPKFKSKFVNWIASSCLASFILHTCNPVFSWLINKDITYFSQETFPIYCLKIGGVILGVFALSILLDKIRLLIFSPLIKWIGKIKQLN